MQIFLRFLVQNENFGMTRWQKYRGGWQTALKSHHNKSLKNSRWRCKRVCFKPTFLHRTALPGAAFWAERAPMVTTSGQAAVPKRKFMKSGEQR